MKILVTLAFLFFFVISVKGAEVDTQVISLSGNSAAGFVIGVGLIGMLFFSVKMLEGIQISNSGDLAED
ncbi:unnamed protein product [Phytomonas sp. Hart1]|nr:unnamed protein product [Phytomonas sp. Hart1]|eukprot:CCW70050.1 unnamed protein product [Phytomonas sp. isolate Hart1]